MLPEPIRQAVFWAAMNGLQIFPNLVGVIGLSGVAAATLKSREAPAVPAA